MLAPPVRDYRLAVVLQYSSEIGAYFAYSSLIRTDLRHVAILAATFNMLMNKPACRAQIVRFSIYIYRPRLRKDYNSSYEQAVW